MFRVLALLFIFGCLTATPNFAQLMQATPAAAVPAAAANSPATVRPPVRPREDWTKLPVDRTVLKPLVNGASLGKGDYQGYTRELIRLQWRSADPIDIYVVKPHGVEKPRVVLYLYSFPSDNDRFRDDGWCERATKEGMAAVGFVSALTGDRFRGRPMREWFIPELQESLGSSVHDVQLILDYLAARGDLSVDKVGMWGQGSGASIAILAAAADPRIRALDLLDPWGDWPDWMKTTPMITEDERAKYLTPEFLQKVSMLDPIDYLPQLQDRAIRVQQIVVDLDTPAAARDKIASTVPHDRLTQFKDAAAHREAWKETGISGWIASQLQPALQPLSDGTANR